MFSNKKSHLLPLMLALLTALAIGLLRPNLALADGPITVNTTTDEFGAGAGCSLREAIQSANQDADFGGCTRSGTAPYTIIVPTGTYTLTIAGTNENANINGDLDILTTTTISGAGAGSTIIDGNADERVLDVNAFSSAVTITNVGITNGGGIGGIANRNNNSTLTLNNSAVFSNSSAAQAGGIYNINGATLTLNNSTVFSNSATSSGGGIYNSESPLTLNNSTVSGNSSKSSGGGIYNDAFFDPSTLNLNHSTITANTADSDTAGGGDGGGIYNTQLIGTATVNFTNTIVAGNRDNSTPAKNDCATGGGTQNSLGYNIIGNNDGCSVTAGTGDNFGTTAGPVDPGLLALADNGGGTQTHALANGSPALEGAVCLAGFTTDQRGQPRPNPGSAFCDIGAYESTSAAVRDLALSKIVSPATANPGDTITYTLTFSNAGTGIAAGVIITDSIPVSVTHSSLSYTYTGATVTATGSISYVWNVEDLSVGEGGVITISGVLSDPLTAGLFDNTAVITTTSVDSDTLNNTDLAGITVLGPEIAVIGKGQSIPNGSTAPTTSDDTDFGSVSVGGTPVTHTFTISNLGNLDLNLTGTPNVTLTYGAAFTVTQPASTTIGASAAATFNVTFDPSAAGSFTDTVNIANNDADENPYTFVISGTGVANDPPTAGAGTTQAVDPGDATQLDGSGSSDPNGDSLTYGWTQTGGESVTLSSSSAVSPTFTAPAVAGVLTFSLTVTDTGNLSDSDAVTVTVNASTTPTYTLTVNIVGNGRVDLDPSGTQGSGTVNFASVYTAGTVVTMTAAADTGWRFDGWSGNASGGTVAFPLLMDSDKVVTATFVEESATPTYTLSVNILGSGRVDLDPIGTQGTGTVNFASVYTAGTVVTLTAVATTGWRFDGWSGDASGTAAFPLMMNSSKAVTATFIEARSKIYLPLVLKN